MALLVTRVNTLGDDASWWVACGVVVVVCEEDEVVVSVIGKVTEAICTFDADSMQSLGTDSKRKLFKIKY